MMCKKISARLDASYVINGFPTCLTSDEAERFTKSIEDCHAASATGAAETEQDKPIVPDDKGDSG